MTETLDLADAALNECDREPIHIPQSIQPHGCMLVLDLQSLTIRQGAGAIEELTGRKVWIDRTVADVLGDVADRAVRAMAAHQEAGFACRWRATSWRPTSTECRADSPPVFWPGCVRWVSCAALA